MKTDTTELICDNCGRIETEPFEVGDACYRLCGGKFIVYEEEKYSGNPDNNPRKNIDTFYAPMVDS